jgi:proteic killer suppression protein
MIKITYIREYLVFMIVEFTDDYLLELYEGTQKGKPKYSQAIIRQYRKTVQKLKFSSNVEELRQLRSLNFESLLNDYYSVRVNKQYRLILTLKGDHLEICVIEELSKHYE